jgi:hypothetical protein
MGCGWQSPGWWAPRGPHVRPPGQAAAGDRLLKAFEVRFRKYFPTSHKGFCDRPLSLGERFFGDRGSPLEAWEGDPSPRVAHQRSVRTVGRSAPGEDGGVSQQCRLRLSGSEVLAAPVLPRPLGGLIPRQPRPIRRWSGQKISQCMPTDSETGGLLQCDPGPFTNSVPTELLAKRSRLRFNPNQKHPW